MKSMLIVEIEFLADLHRSIIDSQLKFLKEFPCEQEGCLSVYQILLEYLSVDEILQWNCQFAEWCLTAMKDRRLASQVN